MSGARRCLVAVGLIVLAGRPQPVARGEVSGYTTRTEDGRTMLTSVTVRRGGGRVVFDAARLIGARATHFRTDQRNVVACPSSATPPAGAGRAGLVGDRCLNSGLLNPGGGPRASAPGVVLTGAKAAPGLAVRFDSPAINLPGDDVVVFELHRRLYSPPGGDAFHVVPLAKAPGLKSLTVRCFDVDLDHPAVLPLAPFRSHSPPKAPQSLADLIRAPLGRGGAATDFFALAVAIDLTDLGYPAGAKVDGLLLQDCDGRGLLVDPVYIAALPAPVAPNVLAKSPAMPRPPALKTREQFLAGPLKDISQIVFAVRVMGWDHWYANFGRYSAPVTEYPPQRGSDTPPPKLYGEGGRLCVLHLRTGKLDVLLDDPRGGVRDPQVHYDGKRVLFSYRKGAEEHYHLWEMDLATRKMRQLTRGPWDDIEPTYLPDRPNSPGGIVFCSSRCDRWVNCYRTPVAVLYRCDADGGNLRPISTNVEHDNTPWPLPDGRLIYLRWEYVDRSQLDFHHLWVANPDGTGQMVFYGNERPGMAFLDAKPIPHSNRVVASFSPGHGRPGHMGAIHVISPDLGPDSPAAARRVSKPRKYYRDPYPISEDCFLVADGAGLHAMDGQGNTALLYRLPAADRARRLRCHEPRPLRPRPRETRLPDRTDPASATGWLFLQDVHLGRKMEGVKSGEIRTLLVLEQLPKPINFSGGPWPLTDGGSFTLSRILGTVPVRPDGSAYFEAPAMRSLFFVALDADGLAVKRMQSFCTVQPGEVQGCVGCHERRVRGPDPGRFTATMRRTPDRITPFADVPDVIDYPRDVQPILDKHCTRCHNPDKYDGRVDLTGDHTPLFCTSYRTLLFRGLISDGRNEPRGSRPPRTIGSSASPLLKYLDGTHYKARLSAAERRLLRLWIDASCIYAGTYASLGSGMHPVSFPHEVMARRCGSCHGKPAPETRRIGQGKLYYSFDQREPYQPLADTAIDLKNVRAGIGYYKYHQARPPHSFCDLTHPAKSHLLLAPLAKAAGGHGICKGTVFADTRDPDYRALLAAIQAAARKHAEEKRFDMPGFVPNVYYLRELVQGGFLPRMPAAGEVVDFRKAERAYWRSFWYTPGK